MTHKKVVAKKKDAAVKNENMTAFGLGVLLSLSLNAEGNVFTFTNHASDADCVFTVCSAAEYSIKIKKDLSVMFEWSSEGMINAKLYDCMLSRMNPENFGLPAEYSIAVCGNRPYRIKLTRTIQPCADQEHYILEILFAAAAFSLNAAKFKEDVRLLWRQCSINPAAD